MEHQRERISEGYAIECLDVDPQRTPIKRRGQRSHARIGRQEYLKAVELLGGEQAFDIPAPERSL